jgi:hypothetical protein
VAVVQYTFTHKQYTEYRERNIHNNKKLNIYNNKKNLLIWEVRAVPRLCELYPGICLTTEEKVHGKTSVRVAARTSQQTQYNARTMNSTIHRRKTVTQSSTMSQNNKEHRIHNRQNTPFPCINYTL